MYLVSISRKVKTRYIKKDDKKVPVDEVTEEFDKNSEAKLYYRNQLLNGYLSLLKNHGKRIQKFSEEQAKINAILDADISFADFSVKLETILEKQDIKTVGDLLNFGETKFKSLISDKKNKDSYAKEVEDLFKEYNINWDTEKQIPINGIIESGDINIALRPVDSDTDLIKNVLKRIERNKPTERYYAY